MCGIVGFWGGAQSQLRDVASRMAKAIESRGPDDEGVWVDNSTGLSLAHRRLSILDLSPAGHQPMVSPCGRYVLVYNGEIYNHHDLRRVLEAEGGALDWRGHSDTETLLAALRHWGVEGALHRVNGMFAFALWDAVERTLFLARDRMGEKPLYYGRVGSTFLFASELKALAMHPDWYGEVDRGALALFLRHSYVPAPWSIYQGIAKLSPAHYVTVRENGAQIGRPKSYWDLGAVAENGTVAASGEEEALADELDALLRDSVRRRMAADVPLGAFLSGGYDSSTVAALMQKQSERPVKTFTIGFHEAEYNEADAAAAVAKHLGTDHTELYVTSHEAMAIIPRLPAVYDEPFSDSSQIPTFLVSQLARKHVTVSLSGDGGDELFAGYNRHIVGPKIWSRTARLPWPLRRALGRTLGLFARADFERLASGLRGFMSIPQLGLKLEKLTTALQARDEIAFYKDLASHWKRPENVLEGVREPETLLDQLEAMPNLPGLRERMMFLDMMTYLPNDILTKVDRASMAVSLEVRVPLLDHRVVEFAWRVPSEYKCHHGRGKWLLRRVLYRYLPQSLMDRPKMGFGVPIGQWLRGPLREWAEALLEDRRLCAEGFFNPEPIRNIWVEHLSGKRDWAYHLWDVLMFEAWLQARK
jgi:asparagine synthase (glutamine-hydrolysing)